ncbi:MAG: hypothetical protein WC291_10330 [Thermodesulfovibrionales bacterium]|jgi:hypothetical protein
MAKFRIIMIHIFWIVNARLILPGKPEWENDYDSIGFNGLRQRLSFGEKLLKV